MCLLDMISNVLEDVTSVVKLGRMEDPRWLYGGDNNTEQLSSLGRAATINIQSAVILHSLKTTNNMSSMTTWTSSGNCREDQRRRDQVGQVTINNQLDL